MSYVDVLSGLTRDRRAISRCLCLMPARRRNIVAG
jgi:hypothetical protein